MIGEDIERVRADVARTHRVERRWGVLVTSAADESIDPRLRPLLRLKNKT